MLWFNVGFGCDPWLFFVFAALLFFSATPSIHVTCPDQKIKELAVPLIGRKTRSAPRPFQIMTCSALSRQPRLWWHPSTSRKRLHSSRRRAPTHWFVDESPPLYRGEVHKSHSIPKYKKFMNQFSSWWINWWILWLLHFFFCCCFSCRRRLFPGWLLSANMINHTVYVCVARHSGRRRIFLVKYAFT